MALTKVMVQDAYVEANDWVRARTFAKIYDDGKYMDTILVSNRLIQPDEDYSNEPGKIRRACDSQFIATVKTRHSKEKLYNEAKQARREAVALREALEKAKEDAYQARVLAKAAHDEAVLSGDQAEIDKTLVLKDKAIAVHALTVTVHAEAVTVAADAETARLNALGERTYARDAHEAFLLAEG